MKKQFKNEFLTLWVSFYRILHSWLENLLDKVVHEPSCDCKGLLVIENCFNHCTKHVLLWKTSVGRTSLLLCLECIGLNSGSWTYKICILPLKLLPHLGGFFGLHFSSLFFVFFHIWCLSFCSDISVVLSQKQMPLKLQLNKYKRKWIVILCQ